MSLLAAGALGAGVCRIGWRLAGPVAGIAAAAVLLLSPPVVELVHEGGADLPALALVAWAAVVELERPRRAPALVLALLALAGLLRPEAWLLSLAYLAWLRRAAGARLVALALAAPRAVGARPTCSSPATRSGRSRTRATARSCSTARPASAPRSSCCRGTSTSSSGRSCSPRRWWAR